METREPTNPGQAGVDRSTTPMYQGEGEWIRRSIDRFENQLDGYDERLRTVETSLSSLKTWLIAGLTGTTVILTLVQIALRFFDISLK